MIRIYAIEPETDDWKKWKERCRLEQKKHNEKIEKGEETQAKSKIYGQMKEVFYMVKNGPFHGKCVFCEGDILSGQHGDIDHFRPKGSLKDHNNKPIHLPNGEKHQGYYWLAYDWSNLLPSCQLCNQPSKARSRGKRIGKWNAFPLLAENRRATLPGEEIHEEPMLIHPAIEDPGNDLAIDETGVVFAVEGSVRGKACIEIFGLNERGLPDRRAKKIFDIKRLFNEYVTAMLSEEKSERIEILKRNLEEIESGRVEYALAARWAHDYCRKRLQSLLKTCQ